MLAQAAFAQSPRDGNWWRSLERNIQIAYVLGAFDGTNLGYGFTTWKLAKDKAASDAYARANAANREYTQRYLANVNASQVADGLDVFYADFRNRSIAAHGALWLVLAEIAGDPQADVMLESWRRNATKR